MSATPAPWSRKDLGGLESLAPCLFPGDPGFAAYIQDSVCRADPDVVVRPGNAEQVERVMAYAWEHNIPVTVSAGRTGMAGGAVTGEGVLLSMTGLRNDLQVEVDPAGRATVRAEVGWVLGDLQREMERRGWMYPPDPTSRHEALLGGTLATNATGEDTLLYGPTRRWVAALEVVAADGTRHHFERRGAPPPEEKATAGYYLHGEPIDWFIGSEGTLGVITSATLRLVPKPKNVFSGLAFFPSMSTALDFVVAARESSAVQARALEFMDAAALELVRDNPEGIRWPGAARAGVVFRQEWAGSGDPPLEAWLNLVDARVPGDPSWGQAVLLFSSGRDRERLRAFRHRIPSTLHEKVQNLRDHGGAKVGTDWWVPYRDLSGMLHRWIPRLRETGMEVYVFGHVGNGHPHVNMVARNAGETARARRLVADMCREAVGLGGGVAGEHGLGKLKRELLKIQYPDGVERMFDLKRRWDSKWILGRETLFLPEEA